MADQSPYSPAKLTNASAAGKSGQTHRGGAVFPARLLSDSTSPTKTEEWMRELYLLFERMWVFGLQLAAEHVSGLNIGVNGGYYRKSDGTDVWFVGTASFALADDTANQYVWIDHATGTLAKGASWPGDKTTFTPICKADAANGSVDPESIRDCRTLASMQTHASSTSPTGTTSTSFTMDSDNSGAGADQQLRANRGATDAEDAAVEWDEVNDRWRFYRKNVSKTHCPVDASEFQIAGSAVLTTDGAAKVQAAVAGDGLAHAAGVLAVNVDGTTIEVDTDVVRLKAGGVDTAKLSDTVADTLVQISIADASGPSPRTVTIQAQDIQGNNLAEVVYVRIAVFDDADGAALATNATIADGGAGSVVQTHTNDKDITFKTDANGTLQVQVTNGVPGTVYLLASPTFRSHMMTCKDIGTVTIS